MHRLLTMLNGSTVLKGTIIGLSLLGSACTVRTYEYRDRPVRTVTTTTCDPYYPCSNTYYWDEYRSVYVFYDGYRYYDALGTPGTYPLPPRDIVISYPPPSYVAPSGYRAGYGVYQPPMNYQSPPPNWHNATPVAGSAVPPQQNTGIGVRPPPPTNPGYTSGGYVPPPRTGTVPPPTSGYVPPPSGGGYVPPPSGGGYVPPPSGGGYVPPPSGGGVVAPPTASGYVPPPSGGVVAPPTSGGVVAPSTSGGYVPPPTGGSMQGGVVQPSGTVLVNGNTQPMQPGHINAPPPSVNVQPGYQHMNGQPSGFSATSNPGVPPPQPMNVVPTTPAPPVVMHPGNAGRGGEISQPVNTVPIGSPNTLPHTVPMNQPTMAPPPPVVATPHPSMHIAAPPPPAPAPKKK